MGLETVESSTFREAHMSQCDSGCSNTDLSISTHHIKIDNAQTPSQNTPHVGHAAGSRWHRDHHCTQSTVQHIEPDQV